LPFLGARRRDRREEVSAGVEVRAEARGLLLRERGDRRGEDDDAAAVERLRQIRARRVDRHRVVVVLVEDVLEVAEALLAPVLERHLAVAGGEAEAFFSAAEHVANRAGDRLLLAR